MIEYAEQGRFSTFEQRAFDKPLHVGRLAAAGQTRAIFIGVAA